MLGNVNIVRNHDEMNVENPVDRSRLISSALPVDSVQKVSPSLVPLRACR